MHPLTGTFANPAATAEFEASMFRLAFPVHVAAMAIASVLAVVWATTLTASVEERVDASLFVLFMALGLGARVYAHRMSDKSRAQRLGANVWTGLILLGCLFDAVAACARYIKGEFATGGMCSDQSKSVFVFTVLVFAVLNSSHGLSFQHRAWLVLAPSVDCAVLWGQACGFDAIVVLGLLLFLSVCGLFHLCELVARHFFLRFERLQLSNERLEIDVRLTSGRAERATTRLNYVVAAKYGRVGETGGPEPDSTSTTKSAASAPAAVGRRVRFRTDVPDEPSSAPAAAALTPAAAAGATVGAPAQADVPGSSADHAAAAGPSSAAVERELTDDELLSTPLFLMTAAQTELYDRVRAERAQAAAAAVEDDDAASGALSLPEGVELIDDWVSSEPSTAARERDAEIRRQWKERSERYDWESGHFSGPP